nr:helix-turn-helix transcriptional regulator [Pseudodesulfovibrio sp. SB368]
MKKKPGSDIADVTLRSIHARLEDVIHELGVSKKDFAKAGGVTPQALSGYLAGRRTPDAEVIAKWVRAYNLNANYLLVYRGTVFRSEADNRHPMEIEQPGQAENPPRSHAGFAGVVHGVEQAMQGADELAVLKAVIARLEGEHQLLAKKRGVYGTLITAREPNLHEDHADYAKGSACGIDQPDEHARPK